MESVVSDSLEKGLSYSKNGKMSLSIANPTVPADRFFKSGHLDEGYKILIQIHLYQNRDEDFEGDIDDGLNLNTDRFIGFLPCTDLDSFSI